MLNQYHVSNYTEEAKQQKKMTLLELNVGLIYNLNWF